MFGKFARMAVATLIAVHAASAADLAVIVNSGSTNTAGFRIAVDRSNNAEFTAGPPRPNRSPNGQPKQVRRELPSALVGRLFSDLEAAEPFSSLPSQRCFKSASFGTKLTMDAAGRSTSVTDSTPNMSAPCWASPAGVDEYC